MIDYLEIMETQERIIDYKNRLRDRISIADDAGNRKLNPYYFLSAEVAAYKLLCSWEKQARESIDFVDEGIRDLLDTIEMLIDESYEDFETYEAEISMPLWYELSKSFEGEALTAFNAEIILVASLIESKQGTDPSETLICTMSDEELTDPNLASYAYSIVHDYLISLSKEKLEKFAAEGFGLNSDKGELYKLHFNLFA